MITALPEKEREDDKAYYSKILGRNYLKRGGALAWLSQFESAIQDIKRAMDYKGLYSEEEIEIMQQDIDSIQLRKDSQDMKLQGDILFARNLMDESLEKYFKALELDPMNEYALSNIGVIYLKRFDFDNCLKFTSQALSIIEEFQSETREFQRENILEIKLLQRRAKCLEEKQDFEGAKNDLDRAAMLDKENPQVRIAQQKVQQKLNTIQFDKYKEIGNNYLKEKKFQEAMEYYDNCLRITRKATSLDNVAIYVNKIACLLSLEKFNSVVTESNDALRLIKNYKNRLDGKHSDEDKKRMTQMALRLAVRKGNALAKLNKVHEAIQEYERALKIDPQNAAVQKDLLILQKTN